MTDMIEKNIRKILKEIPENVILSAAIKNRTADEVMRALSAGIKVIGENYLKEAESKFELIGRKAEWHLIGHLQKNKVKKAVRIFDMIETLDSLELAESIDKECSKIGKVMPLLVEVNIASEPNKSGILPEETEELVKKCLDFKNIEIEGLMTMGPFLSNPEELRPYFRKAKLIFDEIKNQYSSKTPWQFLSMGMSSSYKIAIEEGANLVRVGIAIFGFRPRSS